MHESRSPYFKSLFDHLAVTYRTKKSGQIDNTVPLRTGGTSLQMYFNEANSRWGAYFAAHEGLYQHYNWSQYWLPARVGKKEQGYLKVAPYPGQEELAFVELISYVKSSKRKGSRS